MAIFTETKYLQYFMDILPWMKIKYLWDFVSTPPWVKIKYFQDFVDMPVMYLISVPQLTTVHTHAHYICSQPTTHLLQTHATSHLSKAVDQS